ncbi:MAG: thiolase family protein [Chloroflexi bacterium]|nr:thiolase family protein [Chloroflexota bacterium]
MTEVFIVAATRTPFGRFGGILKDLTAAELGAAAISEAVRRASIEGAAINRVILGNCMGAATLGQVPARQAALKAGLPYSVPAVAINTACTSALQAAGLGFALIRHGEAEVIVAGGMESMSQAPYILPQARWGYRLGHGQIVDALTNALTCPISGVQMGVFASQVAQEYGIGRQEQDRWALSSQQRYQAAQAAGKFSDEITPVEVKTRKGEVVVTKDEQPRPDTTYEKLAALPPAFEPEGTVTAGNAPGLNDGAAALVLMSRQATKACPEPSRRAQRLEPLARIVATAHASAAPQLINVVPALAAQNALQKAGLTVENIDLWEINEAFAAVTLTAIKILGLDPELVNVNGGSVAIGHPVGATGARILMTLIYELRRRGGGTGLATICGAGANGYAMIVEVAGQ